MKSGRGDRCWESDMTIRFGFLATAETCTILFGRPFSLRLEITYTVHSNISIPLPRLEQVSGEAIAVRPTQCDNNGNGQNQLRGCVTAHQTSKPGDSWGLEKEDQRNVNSGCRPGQERKGEDVGKQGVNQCLHEFEVKVDGSNDLRWCSSPIRQPASAFCHR